MQACAVGYALIYLTIPKLQLVGLSAVGQTIARFKPLIFPMYNSAGRLNYYSSSAAQSFLATVFSRSITKIFLHSHMYVLRKRPPFRRGRDWPFFIGATFVAP
jgi:hypothetical protein